MSVLVGESVPPGEKGISTYVERCALLYSSPLYGSHALQYLVTYVLLTVYTYCLQWWGYEFYEGRDNAGHSGAFLVVRSRSG
jgi:hypothetical protein